MQDRASSTLVAATDDTLLPSLPSLKKKREANVTPRVLAWFKYNGPSSCAIEIKATTSGSIPESALLPHQKAALLAACKSGVIHKLSDEARRQQPFDAFKISYARAFVVCCFLKEGLREALVIDVKEWRGAKYDTPSAYRFTL